MGIDPRIIQPFNTNLNALLQLLSQRKQQKNESEKELKQIQIQAAVNAQKSKNPSTAAMGETLLREILGGPEITPETITKNTTQRMLENLFGKIAINPKADPTSRETAFGIVRGEVEPEEFIPKLQPVDVASVKQKEASTSLSGTREKLVEKSIEEAAKGDNEKSTTILMALVRDARKTISDFEKNLDPVAEALKSMGITGANEQKPQRVIEAEESLKLYLSILRGVVEGRFAKEFKKLNKLNPAKKEHINSIKALKKKLDSGDITEDQFRGALLRLERAGISRDTILKAMQ